MEEVAEKESVESYRARFRGQFRVEDESQLESGTVFVCLVQAACQDPQYRPVGADSDQRYQLSVLHVLEALPLCDELREDAIVYMKHGHDQTYLTRDGEVRLPFQGPDIVAQLREVHQWLDEIGELHEGESLLDAIMRLSGRQNASIGVSS